MIRQSFEQALQRLQDDILLLGSMTEQAVMRSVEALRARDVALARQIIADDMRINQKRFAIEDTCVDIIARQQPMARDLRFIVGAIKISSDLERVGDHAVNIAQCTLRLLDVPVALAPGLEIDEMAKRARGMLGDAIDAFIRADGALGRAVCKRDDEVDALEESTFRVLLTHMMESAATISPGLQLLLVSRNLERVADLATNIGEDAVYLAEGKQIKHHFEERAQGKSVPPRS